MENVQIQTQGTKLIVTIDTAVDLGMSKSGKSHLVASTQGNAKVSVNGRDLFLGVNCYTK